MSGSQPRPGDLDARLRRALSVIDTSPGFEARVAARIAAMHPEPADVLRERVESERLRAARRLRRDAWMNAASAAGVGLAALAVVWRQGPAVAGWMEGVLAAAVDPGVLGGIALAVLAAGLWPVLRGLLPR
jgi:hypothetical protein